MPVVLWKEIKPTRFDKAVLRRELKAAAVSMANDIELDFELTVSKWNRKPKFEKDVSVGPNSVDILVGTDDEIYGYVSRGTGLYGPKHSKYLITPKRPGYPLRFRSGYNAKTMPGVIGSQAGGAFGPYVYAMSVEHPGIKARKFEEALEKKWRPRFKRIMEGAMRKAAHKSGHSFR